METWYCLSQYFLGVAGMPRRIPGAQSDSSVKTLKRYAQIDVMELKKYLYLFTGKYQKPMPVGCFFLQKLQRGKRSPLHKRIELVNVQKLVTIRFTHDILPYASLGT